MRALPASSKVFASGPARLAAAAGVVAVCTAVAIPLRERLELANLVMLYLLAVVGVAAWLDRSASVSASILAVAAFDWFCVPPYGTFLVADTRYLPVFAVMLVVALVISGLTARLRDQAEASRGREGRTAVLLAISRELLGLDQEEAIAEVAARKVGETFDARVGIFAPDPFGRLRELRAPHPRPDERDEEAALWALKHRRPAGPSTGRFRDAAALWIPLDAGDQCLGVMSLETADPTRWKDPPRGELLEAIAAQAAAGLVRARLARESRRAEHLMELNRLKSQFVAVAAHELRNPLGSLGMAVELLAERWAVEHTGNGRSRALLAAAVDDARRLREISADLLDLSRLEARRLDLQPGDVAPAELVARAVASARLRADEAGIELVSEPSPDLPAVRADRAHLQRALDNLVKNALEHASERIVVSADPLPAFVQFSVADDGPGVPVQAQEQVFEPFVGEEGGRGGAGLGLAIAREVVRAHGGEIWVDSGPGPGAVFSFTIPVAGSASPAESRGVDDA